MDPQAHNQPIADPMQQAPVANYQEPKKKSKAPMILFLFFLILLLCGGAAVGGYLYGKDKCECPKCEEPTDSDTEVDMYSCSSDKDCILVKSGCCGCTAGGNNTTINKNYESDWKEDLTSRCNNTLCPAVMSSDPSCIGELEPRCVEEKCKLGEGEVDNGGTELTDKESCEDAGNSWEKGGLADEYFCNEKTTDGDEKCTDNEECEGFCIVNRDELTEEQKDMLDNNESIETHGYCSTKKTIFGCFPIVENSMTVTVCVD